MTGTQIGGMKAAATNKAKYGGKFYQQIGRLGGKSEHSGKRGFAANLELAKKAGTKGGQIGQRGENSLRRTTVEPIADKIIKEYENGDSLQTIAKRHKLSYNVLRAWAKENIEQVETWVEK